MTDVVSHYSGSGGLTTAIRTALTNAGADGIYTATLAPVDEFHIRGRAATLEIAEALAVDGGSTVLDVGSGLGGPARTLAEVIGCQVVGIDLTPEFCETAADLSEWTGLADRTHFAVGDATALDVPDGAFDAAMAGWRWVNRLSRPQNTIYPPARARSARFTHRPHPGADRRVRTIR